MDFTSLSQHAVVLLAFVFNTFTVTSQRSIDGMALWQELHVTNPCAPSNVTTHNLPSQTQSPHHIAQYIINHVDYLRKEAHKLQTHYCKQRHTPEFCREAERLVDDYFKPARLVPTSTGIPQEAIIKRAQDAYSKLVLIHMKLGTSIMREAERAESISLKEKFIHLQTSSTTLRCGIKRYLEGHHKRVIVNSIPDLPMFPQTNHGQILDDIITLKQLKHLLDSLHTDFSDFRHGHSRS